MLCYFLHDLTLAYLFDLAAHPSAHYYGPAILAFLLSAAYTNVVPASGPLHLLFPLSVTLFPDLFQWRAPSCH